ADAPEQGGHREPRIQGAALDPRGCRRREDLERGALCPSRGADEEAPTEGGAGAQTSRAARRRPGTHRPRLDRAPARAAGTRRRRGDCLAALTWQLALRCGRSASHLQTTVESPSADPAKFQKAADGTKAGCPISRLLNTKTTMDARLV